MKQNNLPPSFSLRNYLIQGASGSLLLIACQTGMGLLLAVILARLLGVREFGTYAFCLSIVNLLTVPAELGAHTLLVREVAAYKVKREYPFLKGLLSRIRWVSFFFSVLITVFAGCIGLWVYHGKEMMVPFLIAMAIIPCLTIMNLNGACLRGLGHILLSRLPATLIPVTILFIVGANYCFSSNKLTPEFALSAQWIGTLGLFTISCLFIYRYIPQTVKYVQPAYETSKWYKSMLPFALAGSIQILNKETSIVILNLLQGPESVGLYRVAQRGAVLVSFGLMAINMAIAPTVSELFVKGETKRLQHLISKSVLAVLAYSLPVTLFLIVSGSWLVPIIFGHEYSNAYIPLVILCIGQLISAIMGSVGLILNMIGLERSTAWGVVIATIINIFLNLLLIPFLGTIGAAIGTSVSLIIWNILLAIWLYKKTGLVSVLATFTT